MIVDDETVFRRALSEGLLFMLDGITVYSAENGEQALAIIRTMPVDLVITDLSMPLVDGLGVVPGMNEFRPTTPVIVMTAYADFDTVIDLQMGGMHYFDKPLTSASWREPYVASCHDQIPPHRAVPSVRKENA